MVKITSLDSREVVRVDVVTLRLCYENELASTLEVGKN